MWLQLKITVQEGDAELLSEVLSDAGAASVTMTDAADTPVYEPLPGSEPLWADTNLTALFADRDGLDAALQALTIHQTAGKVGDTTIEELADRDWVGEGQKQFPIIQFGQLWVAPQGTEVDDANATVVFLQPGIAFGTGTHPTTALCLQWLAHTSVDDKRLLDYGCGSGILAIAGAKLGARHVMCVDHDVQALESTQRNAKKNAVAEKISIDAGDTNLQCEYDLILANILLNPLLQLAPRFAQLLVNNGTIVLSGVTEEQLPALEDVYNQAFEITETVAQDGWLRVTARLRT